MSTFSLNRTLSILSSDAVFITASLLALALAGAAYAFGIADELAAREPGSGTASPWPTRQRAVAAVFFAVPLLGITATFAHSDYHLRRPPRERPSSPSPCSTCALTSAGVNVTVRIPIAHPRSQVSHGFSDGNLMRDFGSPDAWGISYNIGPSTWFGSHLQIPCGVFAFTDVVDVTANPVLGRDVVMRRAVGVDTALLTLDNPNFDSFIERIERAPPSVPAHCAAGDATAPDAPSGARPVYFWVDAGWTSGNLCHWVHESAIFLERFRCVRAHFPRAKLIIQQKRRFKTHLSALYGITEQDIVAAPLPCDRGNIVLLPPLYMLNQWETDMGMGAALAEKFWAHYPEHFGLSAGCASVQPLNTGEGALLMLPHGRGDHNNAEFIGVARNNSYEPAVLSVVKALGGSDFYGEEANDARRQLEILRRARIVVTSYGTSVFHNANLARGATFIVLVNEFPLHHQEMPTMGTLMDLAARYNKMHFVMGAVDVGSVRALIIDELAQPPLPCPIPKAEQVSFSGCAKKNAQGHVIGSSFGVCE